MVFEATYSVAVLTAGQTSPCCGQDRAQISKVFRPINKSNGRFICFRMAAKRTGSECGLIQPPYAKPPLVSSSGPPGACMTPSSEANSSTLTFLMTEVLLLPAHDQANGSGGGAPRLGVPVLGADCCSRTRRSAARFTGPSTAQRI